MSKRIDTYEKKTEQDMERFEPVNTQKKARIEDLIDAANEKKSISLRIRNHDLERLKRRAEMEGLPYQTLLSSIVHKFVTDQLVDKRSILKSMEILKAS